MPYIIASSFKRRLVFVYALLSLAVACFLIDLLLFSLQGYYFFGLIAAIISGFIMVFNTKKTMTVTKDHVLNYSKSILDGEKQTSIPIKDIREIKFMKAKTSFFGGRNPMASADAQTLSNGNQIIVSLLDNQEVIVKQIGTLIEFKQAFELIQLRMAELKNSTTSSSNQ